VTGSNVEPSGTGFKPRTVEAIAARPPAVPGPSRRNERLRSAGASAKNPNKDAHKDATMTGKKPNDDGQHAIMMTGNIAMMMEFHARPKRRLLFRSKSPHPSRMQRLLHLSRVLQGLG
jgi:hypothetical protein